MGAALESHCSSTYPIDTFVLLASPSPRKQWGSASLCLCTAPHASTELPPCHRSFTGRQAWLARRRQETNRHGWKLYAEWWRPWRLFLWNCWANWNSELFWPLSWPFLSLSDPFGPFLTFSYDGDSCQIQTDKWLYEVSSIMSVVNCFV